MNFSEIYTVETGIGIKFIMSSCRAAHESVNGNSDVCNVKGKQEGW